MKKTLLFLSLIITSISFAQKAKVQVIHNSPDAALEVVDIYVDGNLFIDNFKFRTATEFLEVRAGSPINVAIAAGNSTSIADAFIHESYTLMADVSYVAVADGLVSTTGYTPFRAMDFKAVSYGKKTAATTSTTDLLVHHGSTDAPTVDLVISNTSGSTVVDNLSYGNFKGYLTLDTSDYILEVKNSAGTVTLATFEAPLATLGLQGVAITAVASGFFNPTNNSNGPEFGIYVALPEGGDLLALPLVPLSVNNAELNTFKLYPNPATQNLYLEGLNMQKVTLDIMDIQGRRMNANSYTLSNATLDVSNLSNGLYHLVITDDQNNSSVRKFIKR